MHLSRYPPCTLSFIFIVIVIVVMSGRFLFFEVLRFQYLVLVFIRSKTVTLDAGEGLNTGGIRKHSCSSR